MKITFFEKLIGFIMTLIIIATAPIIMVVAVLKTAWTFFKGGMDAIKDE